MYRLTLVFAAVAALATGCAAGAAQPPSRPTAAASDAVGSGATASTAAAPTPNAAPSATGAPALVLGVDGIGPYRIGARGETLRAAGLLGAAAAVDPQRCPDLNTVETTGRYRGTLMLLLRHDVLVEIGTAGGETVRSPEGASVGSSWDEVRKAYGNRGSMREDGKGHQGFVVPAGDRVMLFAGHPIRAGVGWFAVGRSDQTLHAFLTGEPC